MANAAARLDEPTGARRMAQKLVHFRKPLSVYHTRPEAAELMANLAVTQDPDWSNPETAREYRMANYSCGVGELLIAAYRRVRELHRQAGRSPREIHASVMERSITAVDILPVSVTLAASGLDALETEPAESGGATQTLALRYGPINGGMTPKRDLRQANRPRGWAAWTCWTGRFSGSRTSGP